MALIGVVATLLVGTPALTLIGAIGAAATVTVRRGGLLMALLVLPLTIPVLIFGVSAAEAASGGTVPFDSPFAILCAITLARLRSALSPPRRRCDISASRRAQSMHSQISSSACARRNGGEREGDGETASSAT